MKHSEFEIGKAFWCGGRRWRTTDIGTRVVVAICIDAVDIHRPIPETVPRNVLRKEGWFDGPPYAVAETVFDENDIGGCSTGPEEGK